MSVILSCLRSWASGPKTLIGDNLFSHLSEDVIKQFQLNNIRLYLPMPTVPTFGNHWMWPFFRPLKPAWRKQLLSGNLKTKALYQSLSFRACSERLDSIGENQENITKFGFRASGVYPLDSSQILKGLFD